jgi:hypothetical protein
MLREALDRAYTPSEKGRDGFYEKLWRDFCSIQSGDVQEMAKDAARYRKVRAMLMGYCLGRWFETLPGGIPVTTDAFDKHIDAAPEVEAPIHAHR